MNPSIPFATRRLQPTWVMHAWGLAGGVVFTCGIAAGLKFISKAPPALGEEEEAEIRSVDIPEPPPPPPPQPNQRATSLPPVPMVFEEAPANSTVRISPTPIPITTLVVDLRPSVVLQFDYSPGQFRPQEDETERDLNHIFQRADVDQQVVAIFKKAPNISSALLKEVTNTRVRVLFVVNTDGTVENVRLLKGSHPEFDRLVIAAISEWQFRPAMRKGRKVRSLSELPVYVKPPNANPFTAN